jgi:hypothetical protein
MIESTVRREKFVNLMTFSSKNFWNTSFFNLHPGSVIFKSLGSNIPFKRFHYMPRALLVITELYERTQSTVIYSVLQ